MIYYEYIYVAVFSIIKYNYKQIKCMYKHFPDVFCQHFPHTVRMNICCSKLVVCKPNF